LISTQSIHSQSAKHTLLAIDVIFTGNFTTIVFAFYL